MIFNDDFLCDSYDGVTCNEPATTIFKTFHFCPFAMVIIFEGLSTIYINLRNLYCRYPSFFESRLGDGLLLSFAFIQSGAAGCVQRASPMKATATKPNDPGSPASFAKPGISRIYKLIRSSRNSRNKFLSSVIRKFDFGASGIQSIPFLMYVYLQFTFNLFPPLVNLTCFEAHDELVLSTTIDLSWFLCICTTVGQRGNSTYFANTK